MAPGQMQNVLKHMRMVLTPHKESGASDQELLDRFFVSQEEAAFELLVWRHHRLVLGVCGRILADANDVEDAFQATFLVLARKGKSIRKQGSLSSWLFGVARRVALEVRRGAQRLQPSWVTLPSYCPEPGDELMRQELQGLLDEQLGLLPEKYRAPVVLCYLEGMTYEEAGQRLGCSKGTISTRLTRARALLRARLAGRGLAVPAGFLTAWLCENAASAGVPNSVVSSTIRAANLIVARPGVATGVIAPKVAALTEGVLKAMMLSKLKAVVAVVLVLGFIVTGATVLSYCTAAQSGTRVLATAEERVKPGDSPSHRAEKPAQPKSDNDKLQGTWRIVEMVTDGKPNTKENPDDEADVIFKGDTIAMVVQPAGKQFLKLTYKLDATKKPKVIDLTKAVGVGKGKTSAGIYELDGDTLKLCFTQDEDRARPTKFTSAEGARHVLFTMRRQKPPKKQENEKQKEYAGFAALGKEAGGLQAGLSYLPGQNRTYYAGETVTLVVRVRNVSKEAVKFQYDRWFFIQKAPAVTDGAGKPVHFRYGIDDTAEVHPPTKVNLAPGKEMVLGEVKLPTAILGTGKFTVQYERVFGKSYQGTLEVDPTLKNLGTGKLDMEIKPEPPPAATGKK